MAIQPLPGHSLLFDLTVTDPHLGETARVYKLHVPTNFPVSNDRPTPLVLDFHGWGGDINSHEKNSQFNIVADEDEEGFLVVSAQGMSDMNNTSSGWGSFNVSRTDSPLGPPCDTNRAKWGETACYDSCPFCDPMNSCDWSSCHDDIVYTKTVLDTITHKYCVDLDSIHQTGYSNGGMFSYYLASLMDDFATISPVAGSPLLGFGNIPHGALSIIDFHGLEDDTIPYDNSTSKGEGPGNTVTSWYGYYYHDKPSTIQKYADGLECKASENWPTAMDGVDKFECLVHRGCRGGGEIVHCYGNFGHFYPFGPDRYIEGTRIMWSFMKTHPKQQANPSCTCINPFSHTLQPDLGDKTTTCHHNNHCYVDCASTCGDVQPVIGYTAREGRCISKAACQFTVNVEEQISDVEKNATSS